MGGFRTPARALTRDLRWPAAGNLHHASPSAERADVSEADMLARETSDADWVETCRSFACHIRDIGSIIRPFRHRDARDEHTPRNASDTLLIHCLLWR
jgi:hypothetical protein